MADRITAVVESIFHSWRLRLSRKPSPRAFQACLRSLDAIIYLPPVTLAAGWSRADVQNRSIDMTAVKTSGGQ